MGSNRTAAEQEFFTLLEQLRLPAGQRKKPPSSLTAAAYEGNFEVAKAFIAQGADINERVGHTTPLAAAAAAGCMELVKLLLGLGAQLIIPNSHISPLDSPAEKNYVEIVRLLLAAGFPVERAGSALLHAAARGQYPVVKLLLEAGVDPEHNPQYGKDRDRKTPADLAEMLGHKLLAEFLRGKPVDEAELIAAHEKLVEEFQRTNSKLASLIEGDPPPLTGAARVAAIERACQLVRVGALADRLDRPAKNGQPPIVTAARNGLDELVKAILAAGGSPDARTHSTKFTALIDAANAGWREIVAILLAAGADVNAKSAIGMTALIGAAEWGDPEIVQMLLDAGADATVRTQGGETAMNRAGGIHQTKIKEMVAGAIEKQRRAAKTKSSAVTLVRGKKIADITQARGAAPFIQTILKGRPEWSLIAVKAPVEAVAGGFAAYHQAAWQPNVIDQRLRQPASFTFAFQLRGHPWSILPRTIGWVKREHYESVPPATAALSAQLQTRAIAFFAEDTSASIAYHLFDNGEEVEMVDLCRGDGKFYFRSKLREKPKTTDGDWQFIDQFFQELGLFIPYCYFDADGYEAKLAIAGVKKRDIARVDFIVLKD